MSLRRLAAGLAALMVLSGGLLTGLGTGTAAAGHPGHTGTTVTAPTLPSVTTVTTPSVPPDRLPGYNRPTVLLGDMNTPEQFIIGQLYRLALGQVGYSVSVSRNIGAPWVRETALKLGSLDLYPEYLGQWNSRVAHLHRRFQTLAASYGAGSAWARLHGFRLLTPTPFSDTSGVAVTTQYARENHVRSIPDLAHGTGIVFGAPIEFQMIPDGMPVLAHAYHLHPGYIQDIGIGLQYWWLNTGNVQAAYSTTTDPELAEPQFVELTDPRHVFGFGNVVPVTTPKVLKAEGPAFQRTIDRVDALLTERAMRGLNREIVLGGHNPTAIAADFLMGNGILPPSQFAPVPVPASSGSTTTGPSGG